MLQYRPFCLARDIDDKAYVRRGTFEGFENSRNVRTITLTEKKKSLESFLSMISLSV